MKSSHPRPCLTSVVLGKLQSAGPPTDCPSGLEDQRGWKFPGEACDFRTWRHRRDVAAGRVGRRACACGKGGHASLRGEPSRAGIFTNKMLRKCFSALESTFTVAVDKCFLESCSNTKNHFTGVKHGGK